MADFSSTRDVYSDDLRADHDSGLSDLAMAARSSSLSGALREPGLRPVETAPIQGRISVPIADVSANEAGGWEMPQLPATRAAQGVEASGTTISLYLDGANGVATWAPALCADRPIRFLRRRFQPGRDRGFHLLPARSPTKCSAVGASPT